MSGTNHSQNHPSTLLIPESVVWLPYAGLVIMVISWLGYDFYRFHRKNKLKYARMRETLTVEKEQPSRKRINMISSVGLRYKNGLPVLGDVWNTSPSASEYSSSSHPRKTNQCFSTDVTPSDDEGPLGHELRVNSEISTHEDDTPSEMPVERRKARSPRYVGSGGGSERSERSERSKAMIGDSQTSFGFSVHEASGDGGPGRSHPYSPRTHGRSKKSADKIDEGGGGGVGVGGGGGGIQGDDAMDSYYPDGSRPDSNVFEDDRVVGDSATQTSFTVADLHYNTARPSSQMKDPGGTYTHPAVMNPRVLAISPPKSVSVSGRESPRSHRTRQNSQSSLRQTQSPRAIEDTADQPVIIDFSKSYSARDERSGESSINPSTPKHQPSRRRDRDNKPVAPTSGRRNRESFDAEKIDEPVFPGSIRRLPATPDVFKQQGSVSSASTRTVSSAFSKPQSSSKRQTSFSRHASEIESYDNTVVRTRSHRDERPKSGEPIHYHHPQSRKERDREPLSARNPSPDTRESSSQKTRTSKSSRPSSSPKSSSERRHHRKSSESSRHSSSESPKIPSHFYHEDEEGFFSSKSSRDHSSSMQQETQQVTRKGIHFFSQLASGRRDSTSGFNTRKSSGGAGGGGGFDGDDGCWHGTGFYGGGFDS